MGISARPAALDDIAPLRDFYRGEMHCQIVHDHMHYRKGWTESYLLEIDGATAGYGSVLVGGPWTGKRSLFEFYAIPPQRLRLFDLFECLREASGADSMEVQSNDVPVTIMLHTFARNIAAESIVFEDRQTTALRLDAIALRPRGEPNNDWVLELDGTVAASGGILYHYNRPYGDIYMQVTEEHRQKGFGAYIVQELKRICYEGGSIPCARCNPNNVASRKTLQKAGFVPYAHILTGELVA